MEEQLSKQEHLPESSSLAQSPVACASALTIETIFLDRKKAIASHNKQVQIAIPVLLMMLGLAFLVDKDDFWWMVSAMAVSIPYIYISIRRKYSLTVQPVIDMRQDGLEMHSINGDLFLPWNEIKEARVYKVFGASLVSILPYDLNKSISRGSLATRLCIRLNALFDPIFEIVAPSLVAPITIPEYELPLSAAEIAELINERRSEALVGIE